MRRIVWIALAAALVLAPVGWVVSDHLEAQNEFCTSCHLDATTPLHTGLRRNFESAPAVNMASAHFAHDQKFRCIDCHRGASFGNRVRVKLLAARDALVYLTGRFDEPTEMRHPLWNEDCTQCHRKYEPERDADFHAIDVHNLPNFRLNCVQCHQAHPTGRSGELAWLAREPLLEQCRNCHEEF